MSAFYTPGIGGGGSGGAGATFLQNTRPAQDATPGIYIVQQGDVRGIYVATGNFVYQLEGFEENGEWPV